MIAITRFKAKRPKMLEGRLLKTNSIQSQSCGKNQSIKKNAPAMIGNIVNELTKLYMRTEMAASINSMLASRNIGFFSLPDGLSIFSLE